MSAQIQSLIALGLVALAAAFLLRSWLRKKQTPGCGSTGACGALSPEVKKLQAKLRR